MSCSYPSKQTDLVTLLSSSVAPLFVAHQLLVDRVSLGQTEQTRPNEPRDTAAATVEEVGVFTR